MSESKNSRGIYWIGFFVCLVAFIFMLIFFNEWFWLTLPPLLTFMIKGLDWM